jgi:thioredoxin reductase (NADPH)
MRQALAPVFERFEHPVVIRSYTDNSNMTAENKEILEELKSMTDKIRVEYVPAPDEDHKHTLSICDESGHEKGLRFHGVPGGHEFNSFVLALYNAAGPGQSLDGETEKRIRDLNRPVKLKIAVSLSCTMCPDLVAAAQRIAADNPHVETDVYDLQHYPDMQKKYNIMSVPCMVINDETVEFGKKSVPELLDLMQA